ncbi:serine/threonine-protein kinase [Sorangium sp. So ce1000]|uniref:serine/threonine-protein kinase n=1 Tax=Sorangium sp. So ce1000 TaxID=3133325 RepID=UPI003F5F95A3
MSSAEETVSLEETLLDKYRVERVLGEGGMGVVLAARHIDLGQLFAIKLLRRGTSSNASTVSRFMREARAAARLTNDHVARVYDVGRLDNGAPYMVMEYLEGSDLSQVVCSRGALPLDEVVVLVQQACDAIAEAHTLGIVHRDLKLANLFLTRRRNGEACSRDSVRSSMQSAAGAARPTTSGVSSESRRVSAFPAWRHTRAMGSAALCWIAEIASPSMVQVSPASS